MTTKEQMIINSKSHYEKNKEVYKQRAKQRRAELKKFIKEYKSKLKCSKCPEDHIACLEFHHEDPKYKEISISQIASRGWSKERLLKEINKCIILCSNCHKKLHYKE